MARNGKADLASQTPAPFWGGEALTLVALHQAGHTLKQEQTPLSRTPKLCRYAKNQQMAREEKW
jgi:hypothetical protein